VSLGNTVSIGQVGVIDLNTGNKVSVAVTSIANSYLTGIGNPLEDLRALTVADYTFLVNKKKEVKRNQAEKTEDFRNQEDPDNPRFEALIFPKIGDYEKAYSIYIDGSLVGVGSTLQGSEHDFAHVTSNDSQAATYISGPSSKAVHADTEHIARDLLQILEDWLPDPLVPDSVSSLSFSTDGAGFKDSGVFSSSKDLGLASAILSTSVEVKYEFNILQYDSSGTLYGNRSAGGSLVMEGGALSSFNLNRRGRGYRTAQAGDVFEVEIIKYEIYKPPSTGAFGALLRPIQRLTKTIYNRDSVPSTFPDVTLPTITTTVGTADFTVERNGSVIKLSSNLDFNIRVEDGLASQGLGLAYKEVDSITELPKNCYNNFKIKVKGDPDIAQDDYYIRFQTKGREDFGSGSYIETVGWKANTIKGEPVDGISYILEASTMPIVLIKLSDGTFILQTPNERVNYVKNNSTFYKLVEDHISNNDSEPGVGTDWREYWIETTEVSIANDWTFNKNYNVTLPGWSTRGAGDDLTNPFPSFTESTINDVFFFKNRLGFLTDSNVVFSEADEYFNFFRTTTQQLLDSAPIDVGLSHTKTAILQHAIPFQEKLMLFSKQSQFVLRGADVLSPKTVAISPVTEYDISDSVEPVALGNYIYFTFKRNDFEGMYEYFVDNNTELFDAEEVTQQVPKYIPKDVRKIAGSQAENTLVISTSEDLKTLYVYKYFWSNKEKIQSAWMKFSFDRDIVGFDFIDSQLYMITKDTEGLHLEFLTLEDGLTDEGLDYSLLLDSRVDGSFFDGTTYLSPTYNTTTKKTTLSGIPYDPTDIELYTKVGTQREVTVVNATLTEKLTNGDFSAVTGTNFDNWSKMAGAYDLTKQAAGILKRSAGNYTIVRQTISFAANTRYKLVFDWSTTGNTASGSGSVNFGEDVTWELTDTTAVSHSLKKDDGDVFYFTTGDTPPTRMDMSIINDDYEWNSISLLQERSIDVTGTLASYVSYSGSIYKCIETHTSTDSETPDTSAKWAVSTDLTSATAWSSGRLYNDDTYFFIGKPYNMLYRFSDQSLKQPTERGGRSASDYTFQTIRNGSINYADTGHFVVEVTPKYRDTYKYVFNPDIVGANLLLNDFEPQNGHFRFAVQGQPGEVTIEVKSDSALPCKLLAAEFESMFIPRSRRYGS
jgi:hypothetical protein